MCRRSNSWMSIRLLETVLRRFLPSVIFSPQEKHPVLTMKGCNKSCPKILIPCMMNNDHSRAQKALPGATRRKNTGRQHRKAWTKRIDLSSHRRSGPRAQRFKVVILFPRFHFGGRSSQKSFFESIHNEIELLCQAGFSGMEVSWNVRPEELGCRCCCCTTWTRLGNLMPLI